MTRTARPAPLRSWIRRRDGTIIEAPPGRRRRRLRAPGTSWTGCSVVDDNKVMKIVYTFFLGALLALFVGLGIQTFYPGPEMPEYPVEMEYGGGGPLAEGGRLTEEQQQVEREYDRQMEQWQDEQSDYHRNVSIASLAGAVLLLVLSLVVERRNRVLTNGIMLGGLFTLLYAIGRSFASQETATTFAAVSVGLAVVLLVGYRRFFQERGGPPRPGAADAPRRETTEV